MKKQRPAYSYLSGLGKLTLNAQRAISYQLKKNDKASQKYYNEDKNKVKSYNPLSTNTSQLQTQNFEKNKRYKSY